MLGVIRLIGLLGCKGENSVDRAEVHSHTGWHPLFVLGRVVVFIAMRSVLYEMAFRFGNETEGTHTTAYGGMVS